MARRRRHGVTLTIAAVLADVALFEKTIDPSLAEDGEASIDHEVQYTYIGPNGRRIGVTKEQLVGNGENDNWPLPGVYEIDIVNSEGNSVLPEPWRAEHFDKDSLIESAKERDGNPGAQLFAVLGEEARISIRNQRHEINHAQARERSAREDLEKQIDVNAQLQKEKNAAIAIAERADAEKDLAVKRQNVAEEALHALENELAYMKPQIAAAVDHGIAQFGKMLGVQGEATNDGEPNAPPGEDGDATAQERAPAPPGADNPAAVLNDLLEKVVFNPDVCRELVEQGFLSWETVRAIVWVQRGVDLGSEPDWGDEDQAASEPDRKAGVA